MREIFVIKNGQVFHSEKKVFMNERIYIYNEKIIAKDEVKNTDNIIEWDAKGKYVSPGFIDIHVHVFENYAKLGINADKIGIEQGVTTVVDAGSSGWIDFKKFKEMIINKSTTEVLSFLNISSTGLVGGTNELSSPDKLMKMEEWLKIKADEPAILGLKARMSNSVVGNQGISPLIHAKTLARETNVPVMVHIGNPPPKLTEIFPLLEKGDIVTHAFHGKKEGILDGDGILLPEAKAALERGIIFDLGHGTSSFSFETIKRFKRRYSYPFTISTDIYDRNFTHPVRSLMTTINKLLAIGYELKDLLQAVTILPAQCLSLVGYGVLNPGNKADITVFDVANVEEELVDSIGNKIISCRNLIPYATWKNGKIVYEKS
ncbi:amidohydrolase/deacetylase family metallohydrolase [Bacillus niameyensis]|uniref:amidohydrolase/deacetylase family metallohydrolase n=1 Tax=Bacillus niameyensis TaxID=1522308 RepID=UPI0007835723|nr:amidohydrolase/deacetylase family metallohydrolase [Bacillus niameyensis]